MKVHTHVPSPSLCVFGVPPNTKPRWFMPDDRPMEPAPFWRTVYVFWMNSKKIYCWGNGRPDRRFKWKIVDGIRYRLLHQKG
jgi:hypothetical protein